MILNEINKNIMSLINVFNKALQKFKTGFLTIYIILIFSQFLKAQGDKTFIVSSSIETAQIVISDKEDSLVYTTAALFAGDVYQITSRRPEVNSKDKKLYQIKAGTVGVNANFDKECIRAGIDTEKLQSKWEAYILKTASDKKKNILYVVGSNPRGTAYGLMELSQMIGISPWYWWADVKPIKRDLVELTIPVMIEDAPKVKFRGIFLNDEDWGLKPWAAKTFEPETGDIGPKTYEKIFELLLRLKANSIWPAMHECTRAFFTYPGNIKMADKYGIWVGSSHCEPMLRNNVDEWHRWVPSTGERGKWNFDENPEQLKEYWTERVKGTAGYDGIYTVGMRGIHDGDMPGGKTKEDKVQILNRVFDAQRNILKEITKRDVTSIPQIFCPYKEVLHLYRAGAKVPDDVTIMWADDNNGYIQQLSNESERKRTGGAGVYYHISYWGRPHDYLWLESVPVSLIWQEMHKAFETNARNVWIVNVGDIKPNEIGTSFFLDMAWNPDRYTAENVNSYYTHFAERQFGLEYASEIGFILEQYFQLGFARKPEHLGWNGVYPNSPVQDPELSLFHYGDEVQKRIDAYDKLERQVEELAMKIPRHLKDAFFQMVGYKVIGASNMNKKLLYAYKSRTYAKQERVVANEMAEQSQKAFERIKGITTNYNNMADGKWMNMMDYNPRRLPVFDMPKTGNYIPTKQTGEGIMPEGYFSVEGSGVLSLPEFNSLTNRSYFVDVFNSGIQSMKWSAEANDPCIIISKTAGLTKTEERIWVSINWDLVPENATVNPVIKFQLNDKVYPVLVEAKKIKTESGSEKIFVEDNGIVSIEAENYTSIKNNQEYSWKLIKNLGRQGDAMVSFPVTALPFTPGNVNSPEMSYEFLTFSKGEAKINFYCLPSQPINQDYQLRFAVSVDDADPLVVNTVLKEVMDENNSEWKNNVLRAATIQEIQSIIKTPGKHTIKIRMIDPGVVIDKFEVILGKKNDSYLGAPETLIRN